MVNICFWRDQSALEGSGIILEFGGFDLPFFKGIQIHFENNMRSNYEYQYEFAGCPEQWPGKLTSCGDFPFVGLGIMLFDEQFGSGGQAGGSAGIAADRV